MCYSEVEKFGCGHEQKSSIPCEAFCETGACKKLEENRVRDDVGPKCLECKHEEAEQENFEKQMAQFGIQESLQPSTTPARVHDPSAPKLYFKRCIVWSRCGHHSHPRPSDIEREADWPEYMPVEGIGHCFKCSAAPQYVIDDMKQNGEYEKEDPWGAMTEEDPGTGSSHDAAPHSLEAIARGMTMMESTQQSMEHARRSPPSSPEIEAVGHDSDEEYDKGPTKGKGRLGEPVRVQHPAAASDSDEDEGEDEKEDEELEDEDEEEDSEDERKLSRHGHRQSRAEEGFDAQKKTTTKIPDWGAQDGPAKTPSQGKTAQGKTHKEPSEDEDSDDEDDSSNEDGEKTYDEIDYASPGELKAAGMPINAKMTREQVQKVLARKGQESSAAMTQFKTNEMPE
ncbi:MAG: hypothetical protein Q9174_001630 [Haloplaca sp. 1 TL-2023]